MNQKLILLIASAMGATAVIIGAFGAHALKTTLAASNRADTFETAVRYHFYHAFAMLAAGILINQFPGKYIGAAGWCFSLGTLVFSGSLYILCLTGITKLGAITPIGGLLMIAGWVLLGISVVKH
ncbi:MAG: DUF423 domain-containing protein [Bacteroidota bacterium]